MLGNLPWTLKEIVMTTPLHQSMVDVMVPRGFSVRTQESYVETISHMARHYHHSPALLSKDEVSFYLLHMVSQHAPPLLQHNEPGSLCRELSVREGFGI